MKVLVVGCGGIGSAIAQTLALHGEEVVVTYHTNKLQAIQLEKLYGIRTLQFDCREEAGLLQFQNLEKPFEAVVWTSGIVYPGRLEEQETESALETFAVNFWGPFFLLKHAPKILPKGGKILLFSSSTSLRAAPGLAVYAASKAALNELILSAAEELIQYGIRIYNLCPGRVATPLRRKIAPEEDQSKIMQPEQVAKVVAFILSEAGDVLSMFPVRIHTGPYI